MLFIRNILRRPRTLLAAPAFIGRARMHDAAFTFRMGASPPGSVNRTHPATLEPVLNDVTNPILAFGLAGVVNTTANSVRVMQAGDSSADAIYGVSVRPFPVQAATGTNYGGAAFGGGGPVGGSAMDVLRSGYITVKVNVGATACTKGGRVFVWVAASSGAHVQGGFETTTGGGSNTIELDEKSYFNGPPDANGVTELAFNI